MAIGMYNPNLIATKDPEHLLNSDKQVFCKLIGWIWALRMVYLLNFVGDSVVVGCSDMV